MRTPDPLRSPRSLFRVAIVLLLQAPAFAAAPPGPRGADIPVNTGGDLPLCPAIAMSASGDFEVVWNLYISGSHPFPQGTFARHFDREGRPTRAAEIRLDSPGSEEVGDVRIVALPGSGYFVFWSEARERRSTMVGRFLDSDGRPTGPPFLLARSGSPVAAAVVDDSLLVAWVDQGPPSRLRARRYDFEGHALGEVLRLDFNAELRAFGNLGLAPLAGGFVVIGQRGSWIIAQRFSLAGKPVGAELQANKRPLGSTFPSARVASNGNDRFAVAWTTSVDLLDPHSGQHVLEYDARARLFDVSGESSPEIHPNQPHTGFQQAWGLALNARGVTLVAWESDRNSAGRFLDPAGQPESRAFPISQNRAGVDRCPAAATDGADAWVVAWLKDTVLIARRLASSE